MTQINRKMKKKYLMQLQSVKSVQLCKSVVQTCFDIVKAHGGKLHFETEQGTVTTFFIELPTKS